MYFIIESGPALKFRTLAADSGWNEADLKVLYRQDLNPDVIVELTCRDDAAFLDSLTDLSIKLDKLLQDHHLHLRPSIQEPTKKASVTIPLQHVCLDVTKQERCCKEYM